jgi:hypothetical protein
MVALIVAPSVVSIDASSNTDTMCCGAEFGNIDVDDSTEGCGDSSSSSDVGGCSGECGGADWRQAIGQVKMN